MSSTNTNSLRHIANRMPHGIIGKQRDRSEDETITMFSGKRDIQRRKPDGLRDFTSYATCRVYFVLSAICRLKRKADAPYIICHDDFSDGVRVLGGKDRNGQIAFAFHIQRMHRQIPQLQNVR